MQRAESSKPRSRLNQLPAIPYCQQRGKHSRSTISINKCLCANDDSARDEGEEQDDIITSAGDKPFEYDRRHSSSLSKDQSISPDRKCTKKKVWPTFESSSSVDDMDVQAMIQRKADSLGLLSRKWAKNLLRGALANSCLTHHLEQKPLPHASGASSKRTGNTKTGQLPEDYLCTKLNEFKSMCNAKSKSHQRNTRGIPSAAKHCEAESKNGYSSNKQERFTRPPTRSLTTTLPKGKWAQHSVTPQSGRPMQIQGTMSRTVSSNGRPRKPQPETYKWRPGREKWGAEKAPQLKGILDIQQRALITTEIS